MMASSASLIILACFLQLQQFRTIDSCDCSGSPKLSFNPTWPPSDPNQLRNSKTGAYDVRVNPLINAVSLTRNALQGYVDGLKKRYHGQKISGSLLYQAVQLHRKLGGNSGLGELDYYPQPVSHFAILKQVRTGLPVEEAPMNDVPLNIVQLPKTCQQQSYKYDIIFLIQSCVQCSNARHHSRHTYLNGKLWQGMKIGYAFVLGIPADEPVKYFQFEEIKLKQPPSYPSDINSTNLLNSLLAESKRYHDMLIGDFEDGMFSYTRNYIFAIRWASIFCNNKTDLFALVDGRYTVFPDNFAKWLKKTPQGEKLRMYGGLVLRRSVVRTPGSVAQVSYQEYPYKYYPKLVNAGFILLGHDTVQESAILTAFTRYLRNVGGYVATVNRKLRIHPSSIAGVYINVGKKTDAQRALVAMASSADRYINWENGRMK